MQKQVLNWVLDLFYPPTEIEKILRKIEIEKIYKYCTKSLEINDNEIYSLFKYKDFFIKNCIYEIKNNKNEDALMIFSTLLFDEIHNYIYENLININQKIIISYIPQHKSTFLHKGYNQSEELVKNIVKIAPEMFEIKNLLYKIKKNAPQHEIKSRRKRVENIKNTFIFNNKEIIKNRLVILIDDVYTTGTTLNESRRVLLENGANKIVCFTIAH
jgi:competence protein ComFC